MVLRSTTQRDSSPFLLRDPTVSRRHVAFSYGGNIWIVNHNGQELHRLTAAGQESKPAFSPDGTHIAFIGEYGGSRGVFVIPAAGGEPRRLTYHPADLGVRACRTGDVVTWTPDGLRILFSSRRAAFAGGGTPVAQLFTVPAEGGPATALPLARAGQAALSPDARHIAYVPHVQSQAECKRYRGGQARFIWIADLADSRILARIPHEASNDFNPIWIGNTIYFLSDRNGPVTLFAYDVTSRDVRQIVNNKGFDMKSASAVSDTIVYEQFGSLHLLDVESGEDRILDIRPTADFPEVRPRFENAADRGVTEGPFEKIRPKLSPSGARAVLSVCGRIVTVPAEKGDLRILTQIPGVAEREPAWSPDGQSIAYFSDESGEYALHIRDPSGLGEVRRIDLGSPPTVYYSPVWSPDSKKIAYSDKRLNYWYFDPEQGTPLRFDTDLFVDSRGGHNLQLKWSPDSRWIVYTKLLPSHLHAVFVYSTDEGKSHQVTDGMSDARDMAFDAGGQYLYFTASTDVALAGGWEMNGFGKPVTRSVYALLLKQDTATPLADQSDEETIQGATEDIHRLGPGESTTRTVIDFEEIGRRIVRLPVPARNYYGLWAGPAGVVFLSEGPPSDESNINISMAGYPTQRVHRFDLSTRKAEPILDDVVYFEPSLNGEKMLYARQEASKRQWFITATQKPGSLVSVQAPLRIDPIEIWVDPRTEWKQMYDEAWRQERDFFYDPGLHGLNLEQTKKVYEPFLDHIVTREELDYLFNEMLSNLTCLHMVANGGEVLKYKRAKIGLLGADYSVENGRYRFTRIYDADPWSANSRSPLCEPGKRVRAGEYLLAVNGREIHASTDVYSYFAGTAGKQIIVRVGPTFEGSGSHDINIVPIEDEYSLRHFAWIERNRLKVDELSGGRVAYVYLPNAGVDGYAAFNRQFFAQVGKEAAIIDDRFNNGGQAGDYILDCLRRPLLNYWHTREGRDYTTPLLGIFGPKVMIINEMSVSMGEHLPWAFRQLGIGPLIGTRTWGGLVGFYMNGPDLLDGGYVATPNLAFYNPKGSWEIENHGVSPDIEVREDPEAARSGRDVQLEKAIEVVMDLLKKNPPPLMAPHHPPYPNYYRER
jgi:tricorn protease